MLRSGWIRIQTGFTDFGFSWIWISTGSGFILDPQMQDLAGSRARLDFARSASESDVPLLFLVFVIS